MDWRNHLSGAIIALRDVLAAVPAHISLNLHVLYPTNHEDLHLGVYSNIDINTFADAILTEVFDHARALRAQGPELTRSIVFSSINTNICTALNWKQPNFPVLLCSDLGGFPGTQLQLQHGVESGSVTSPNPVVERGMSIKESARLSQTNNFMGLTCSSKILQMVPALVETIKQAGLVLVSDASGDEEAMQLQQQQQSQGSAGAGWAMMPEGVNGIMKHNGILRFNETVDM